MWNMIYFLFLYRQFFFTHPQATDACASGCLSSPTTTTTTADAAAAAAAISPPLPHMASGVLLHTYIHNIYSNPALNSSSKISPSTVANN